MFIVYKQYIIPFKTVNRPFLFLYYLFLQIKLLGFVKIGMLSGNNMNKNKKYYIYRCKKMSNIKLYSSNCVF